MTCEYTWPNHLLGSDREAVSALLEQHGLQGDVAFGHSKLFIRSPRTLVTLEQSRARLIPIIVLLLQKVRGGVLVGHPLCGGWVSTESCRLCLAHSTLDGVPNILKSCVGPWLPSLSRFSLSSDGHILGMSLCLWEPWRRPSPVSSLPHKLSA